MSPIERMEGGGLIATGPGVTAFRFAATQSCLQLYVQSGIKLARNFPTLKKLKEMYQLPSNVKTYAQALDIFNERWYKFIHSEIEDESERVKILTEGKDHAQR